jgi:hypothetical protein
MGRISRDFSSVYTFFLNKKVIVTVCKSDQHYSRFLLDIEDMKSFFSRKTWTHFRLK